MLEQVLGAGSTADIVVTNIAQAVIAIFLVVIFLIAINLFGWK